MRKFKFLSIFLLLYPLFATNTAKLAQELQGVLCPMESDIICDKDSYLTYSDYLLLDNDKFLIFFNLVSPNSSPYSHGTNNISMVFDKNGHWKEGEILEGSLNRITRDPQGGIWVSHPWVIEGTSPALAYSNDGKKWKSISFPTKKPSASIESMELCLLSKEITLAFDNFEGKYSYWKTTYADAKKAHPHWKSISKKEYNQHRCLQAKEINSHWYETIKMDQLEFYNSHSKITTILPKHIPIKATKHSKKSQNGDTYSIQMGSFKIKKSMEVVAKELKGINDHPLIQKTLSKEKYKLFLGSFKTKKEAKKALEKLKRRYQKNHYIHEAFVTKLPK